MTTEIFIQRSNEKHNNKFDYSKSIFVSQHTSLIIICPVHGEFLQKPINHLYKSGCKECSRGNNTKSITDFIESSQKIHGTRFGYCCANYVNNNTKVAIVCKKHGLFYIIPRAHTSGVGCAKCSTPKGELKIADWFIDNNISYYTQYSFDLCRNPETNRMLYFDFYLPQYNTLIEFDGEQHYRPKSWGKDQSEKAKHKKLEYTQKLDGVKNAFSASSGIHLLRIPYHQMSKIPEILSSYFNK